MWLAERPFEILYLYQRASKVTLRKDQKKKKKKKKIYIYVWIYIELALMFKVTQDPRRRSATAKP